MAPHRLDLGFGLALGAAPLTGVYALALAMGWLTVTDTLVRPPGQPFVAAVLADAILVVAIAGWEQTVFTAHWFVLRRYIPSAHS